MGETGKNPTCIIGQGKNWVSINLVMIAREFHVRIL